MAELTDLKGVGKVDRGELAESGYSTVESVATATPPELSGEISVGEGKAGKLIERACEEADEMGYELGTDLLERRKEVERIPRGAIASTRCSAAAWRRRASPSSTGSSGRERPSSPTS